eukprot:gene3950-5665_t
MDPFYRGYEKFLSILFIENCSESQKNDIRNSIICGAIAGITAKTVIAPAERIKMNFQISTETFTYKKAFEKVILLVRNHGILSLWKGHSTTVLRVAPYAALSYAFHDYSEMVFKIITEKEQLNIYYKFLAGSIGGACGTVLTYPLDVLRVRLVVHPTNTWIQSIKQGGLFQGLTPTLSGIIPYAGTAWASKQTLLEHFPIVFERDPMIYESFAINALA